MNCPSSQHVAGQRRFLFRADAFRTLAIRTIVLKLLARHPDDCKTSVV